MTVSSTARCHPLEGETCLTEKVMSIEIPNHLRQILEANDILAKKFTAIEINMLSILNFTDFFENLLTAIGKTFSIPHVWFTLIEGSSVYTQLLTLSESEVIASGTGYISRSSFEKLIDGASSLKPILANQDLEKFSLLFPKGADYDIASIAIAPITLDGEIIGSLNQGDPDSERFSPDINTDFLQQLTLKISLCLSNVSAHEKLRALAFYDPLTGLLNRRVMERILKREFERSKRYHTDLSIIFIDLDFFKTINDTYGHDQGDAALVLVSESLFNEKRDADIIARFAGDEFVVILPSTDIENSENYVNRVRESLAASPLMIGEQPVFIAFSHGIASINEPGITTPEALLKKADQRLFQVKKQRDANIGPRRR